jgi:autotransporter-associated beta strand protein
MLRYTGAAMNGTTFNRKIRLNAGGGTLELASTGIGWIAGAGTTSVITGPGSFTKTGTQQLIVSGFTDYDGTTFINSGELQMRDSARGLGSTVGKTVVASGAQLATGGGGSLGTIFENIDLNGLGSSGGGALQCNDGPTATFAGTITLVTDSAIGGGSPSWVISGPVVGDGKLTKVGTQMVTLSGNNSYTGTTTVSAGTLALAGTNVSPVTVTAGTLQLNGSTTGAITVAAAATVAGEGTAPSLTTSGAANLNIDPTTTGAFTATGEVTLGGTLSVGLVGPVTGTGAITVLNYGTTAATAANFALASPASYRGGPTATFTVGAGAVTLNGLSKKSIEWTAGTATWDIAATANFRDTTTLASEKFYNGDDVLFGNLPGVSPTVTLSGTVMPSSFTVNSAANYTFTGGAIGGTTSVLKSGIGAITLGQANTYTGGITISQGAVTLTNATAGGTGPITLGDTGTGSNAVALTTNLAATFANPITVTNNGTGLVTITQSLASTLSGTLTLDRPAIINSNAAAAIFGKITGTVGTLTIGGSNTTSLSNTVASDFTGNIEIIGGTTQATAMANALPPAASLTIRGGVFQLTNGFSQALNALNGGVAGATGVQNANAAAATLTLGSANGSGTFQGNIVNGTGVLSLTKADTGTQLLTGTLTYTGTTAVNQGTLQLPSESTLAGAVTVADGATLAVGGRAGFSLTTNSLTLGTSGATTLAINNLSPAPLGVPLRVNSTLATNGPVTLNVDVFRITATGTYPLVNYPAAGIGGSGFGAFTLGDLPAGFVATLNNNPTAKTIELEVTSVGSLLWAGNSGPAWDVNTTANWLVGATASKYFNGDKVLFDDTAALFGVTLGVPVAPAGVAFNNNGTNDYTLSGAGGIGGSATITKTGTAKVTVTTANPTTGLTSVTGGTLQLGDASANGSVGGNIYNTANLIFANATAQSYAGVISGSPFGLLTKTGAGTLTLTGANTCGDVAVSQGTLQIGDGGVPNLGSIPASSLISVAPGATMAWNRYTGAAALGIGNNISGTGNLAFRGGNSATLPLVSQYSLTGNNTGFTGILSANAARIQASTDTQLGNGPIDIQAGGQLFVAAGATTIANNITIGNGAGWYDSVGGAAAMLGAIRLEASVTLTGNITLNNTASVINGDTSGANSVLAVYNSASNATLSGVISGPGDLSMSRWSGTTGVGSISLTGTASNTYLGKTVVDGANSTNATLRLMKTGGAVAIRSGNIVQMGSNTAGSANLRMGDTATVGAARNQWDNQFGSGVVMNFMTQPAGSHMRFDLQGTNQALAGVSGGTATVQAQAVIQNQNISAFDPGQDATLTLTGSGDYLFNGWFRDADNGSTARKLHLVKSGSGVQTFAGNQITHTGTNTISGGTLVFPARGTAYGDTSLTASGTKLGITGTSGAVFTVPNLTFASGTKLSVGNFANLTGTNKCIDVTSALTVEGPVTVDIPTLPAGSGPFPILKYANSYAGNDFVLDAAAWTLPRWLASPALVNDTTNQVINLTASYTPLIWAGGTSAWDLTTQNWTLGGNPADYDEGDAVQFDESGTATNPNVVLNIPVMPYAVNFMNTTNPYSLAGTGGIGGTAAINKSGTGTVVLKNTNPTTGLTTITEGTLQLGGGAVNGSVGGNLVLAKGTLQLGDGTANGSVGGNIALAGTSAPDATLALNPLSQTFAGIISGSATAGTVSKTGPGTMILTGTNTYAGATTITGGTLQLGDGTIQPTLNSTYAITAPGNLKVQYNTANGAAAQTWTKYTGTGTLALATGKFNDSGWGIGTLTTGFTGNLRIEGGRVYLVAVTGAATNYGLGAATKVTITPGGHLGMWENGITLPSTLAFEIAGFGYGEGAYEVAIRMANGGGATTTVNGPILLTASAALGAQGNGVGTVNGVISGGVGANLTIGGAVHGGSATGWQDGTVALAAANTFVGKVTVNMGTLRLDHALALRNNTLNLNGITGNTGNALGQATFNSSVVGNAFTLGGLEGYRPLALQNTAAAAIALSVGFNDTSTTYTGALTGAGSLIKIGSGTLTLGGVSTYTGATVVNGGTLAVNATLAAAGAVQVGGDSGTGTPVLTGTGTVGVLTVNAAGAGAAGAVNPGAVGTVGVLTSGAATINGSFACDVSGAACDKLVANGNVTLAGPLTITGTASFGSPVVLIDYSSGAYTRTGTFSSVPAGYTVTYDDANKKVLLSTGGGYDSWASQITDVNKRGRGDDADNDGFTNLQEFLFGKNPNAANGSLTTTERTANGLVIHWRERTTNATYKLLESTTLAAPWTQWSPTPPTFIMENDGVQDGDANYGFYQPKKATVPLTPAKNFFRVEGTESN